MSLATTGGGGLGGAGGAAGGGLVLGHDASGNSALTTPPPPPTTTAHSSSSATGSATTASAPVIEVCDKTQRITLGKAKSTAHLPLTAVDLYATNPTVAYFPPKLRKNTTTTNATKKKSTPSRMHPVFLGKMKPKVNFRVSESSHKALRNYLTANTGTEENEETQQPSPSALYAALKRDCLATVTSTTTTTNNNANKQPDDESVNTAAQQQGNNNNNTNNNIVSIDRPYVWLGIRRVRQLPSYWQSQFPIVLQDDDKNNTNTNNLLCWWTDSTLDGSAPNQDYDMDRAVVKVRLHPNTDSTTTSTSTEPKKKGKKKKPLTILPEEATQLLLHQARSHVAQATQFNTTTTTTAETEKNNNNKTDSTESNPPSDWTSFPLAVALPSWALNDATTESLYEAAAITGPAVGGGLEPIWDEAPPTLLFPRSVCAVLGAMIKPDPHQPPSQQQQSAAAGGPTSNQFVRRLKTVQQLFWKQHQLQHGRNATDVPFVASTLVLTVGVTAEGCDVTALQLSYPPATDAREVVVMEDTENEQDNDYNNVITKYCLYEEYQVLANAGKIMSADPKTMDDSSSSSKKKKPYNVLLESCLQEMEFLLDTVAPDADGPAALLTYGSMVEQDGIQQSITQLLPKKKNKKDSKPSNDDGGGEEDDQSFAWLSSVPILSTSPEVVPTGAALLGGVALGRVRNANGNNGGTDNNTNSLPLRIQSVAMVATGVARYYTQQQRQDHYQHIVQQLEKHGNPNKSSSKEEEDNDDDDFENNHNNDKQIKVIFDFDRRLPAGPYSMEFKASECVVHQQRMAKQQKQQQQTKQSENGSSSSNKGSSSFVPYNQDLEEEDDSFWKAVKDAESSRKIPQREQAALDFTVQIFQKYTRHGPWHPVGNPLAPLVKLDTQVHENKESGEIEDDEEETKIACEQVTLEVSMAVTGVLTTGWAGERESVVQAMKSARGRLYEYYGWLAFAILFFGGFFLKSYWEDYVWKRDTNRLLQYYQEVIPGSSQDGDADTARWLAYKYRHKKDTLWHNLETKYGIPVPKDWPSSSFESQLDPALVQALLEEKEKEKQQQQNKDHDDENVDLDQDQTASDDETKETEPSTSDSSSSTPQEKEESAEKESKEKDEEELEDVPDL